MNATISYNNEKQGIELSFPGKPSEEVRTSLKADGFRWGKFNKVWYIKDGATARQKAAKYGQIPAGNDIEQPDEFDNYIIDQQAAAIGLL